MPSDDRLTGGLAVVVALGYLAIGVTHFAMPRDQLHFATGITPTFFASLQQSHGVFTLHYWSFSLTALLAMGVVLGLRPERPGPPTLALRLARVWALLALAVTAIDLLQLHNRALDWAVRYPELAAPAQAALLANGLGRLDPTGFLFALVGVWFLVINRTMAHAHTWPVALVVAGFAAGLAQVAVFPASVLHLPTLVDLAAGLGGIVLAPLWYAWVGLRLLRASPAAV